MDYGQMAQWLAGLRAAGQGAHVQAPQPVAQDGLPPTAGAMDVNRLPNIMSQQEAMMKFQPNQQWNPVATPGILPSWSAGVGVPSGMDRGYLPSAMQGLFKGKGKKGK